MKIKDFLLKSPLEDLFRTINPVRRKQLIEAIKEFTLMNVNEALEKASKNAYVEFVNKDNKDLPFDCVEILEKENIVAIVNEDSILNSLTEEDLL